MQHIICFRSFFNLKLSIQNSNITAAWYVILLAIFFTLFLLGRYLGIDDCIKCSGHII